MPFCKDCEHYQPNDGKIVGPLCERLTYVDMVDGETKLLTCREGRMHRSECGPDGKLFLSRAALDQTDATAGALTHGA